MGGPLMGRQMLRRVVCDLGFLNHRIRFELNERDNLFASCSSCDRPADHSGTSDGWVRVQYSFYFGRIHIQPKTDDQLCRSALDKQITVLQSRQIARVEPTIAANR